jgi:phage terminase large subunit GpA-like protein
MKVALKRSALSVIAAAMARQAKPPVPVSPSQWAEQNLVLPDGPLANEKWSRSMALHCVEIVDALGPDSEDNEISVMKSAQTGFTTALIILAGHSIDRDPCRMMIVQPTLSAQGDFNKEKLQPAIEMSPALARKVRGITSRASDGSTATNKQFAGGSLTLAIANSAADLRSKTRKKVFLDEIDEYPDDLAGQGDPIEMAEARQISFLTTGDWKRLKISTPTIKGASKIETAFLGGDQRKWHVECPGCGERFVFEFDRTRFKFNDAPPYQAHYVAPCCGTIIEGHQKIAVYRTGKYIATAERPGRAKSYHFDAMSSPLVPWDEVARKYSEAKGDPLKLKAFYNLWLGLPYDVRGDAPDHETLMRRRDLELRRGRIPAMGLVLVGAADVQMRGIWYVIKAYAPDRQTWRVDAGYIEGSTEDPHGGAFAELEKIRARRWPDAFGDDRPVDAFGIDSGFRSHVVYTYVRGKAATFALKGLDGWSRPAIGQPTPVDIDFNGRRIKNGAMVWGVGTWPLKGAFYANLRNDKLADGDALVAPAGYCHFGGWMDDVYFRQITSEYLADENFRGRPRKVWTVRKGEENHLLDCEIYCDALADYLGVARMTEDQWRALAAERGVPSEIKMPGFFAPAPIAAQAAPAPRPSEEREAAPPPADEGGWHDRGGSFWSD